MTGERPQRSRARRVLYAVWLVVGSALLVAFLVADLVVVGRVGPV